MQYSLLLQEFKKMPKPNYCWIFKNPKSKPTSLETLLQTSEPHKISLGEEKGEGRNYFSSITEETCIWH